MFGMYVFRDYQEFISVLNIKVKYILHILDNLSHGLISVCSEKKGKLINYYTKKLWRTRRQS